ncbi:MAG: hypothetical protein QF541_05160 [Lentisphaeria bacterium]|jgi:ribose 1,5-bisphosphokinase PhnN|nr:hypothetical protein [Lentisphaeria bacterium]|tara:strand:- start:276 stop:449 length:174 start_codon:yes stop_codon:yes gene_type:complete
MIKDRQVIDIFRKTVPGESQQHLQHRRGHDKCQVATESQTAMTDSEFRQLAEELIVQ